MRLLEGSVFFFPVDWRVEIMYKLWVTDLEQGSFAVEGDYQELLNLIRILRRHYHKDNFVLCRQDGSPVDIPR